mgnify:CR=1 FL=1
MEAEDKVLIMKAIRLLLIFAAYIAGGALICRYSNGSVLVGIFLLIGANNLERSTNFE